MTKAIEKNRVDTLLAIALLPYLTFLARRSISIGDAIEVSLVLLIQARLLMSITGYIPITGFENSFGGALTVALVLVVLNLVIMFVPALQRRV